MKKILDWVIIIAVVLVIRTMIGELYFIPSESMIPSLMVGDKIYVNKLSYGVKLPLSEWKNSVYVLEYNKPEKGEVIVFNHISGSSYVKRIVGVPGDKIRVERRDVYVNGEKLERNSIKDLNYSKYMPEGLSSVLEYYQETNGSNSYLVAYNKTIKEEDRPVLTEITVPKNHYFVMGDDRDFSSDSRVWGFVPHDQIRGRVEVVVVSFIWNWNIKDIKVYPNRVGKLVTRQNH